MVRIRPRVSIRVRGFMLLIRLKMSCATSVPSPKRQHANRLQRQIVIKFGCSSLNTQVRKGVENESALYIRCIVSIISI